MLSSTFEWNYLWKMETIKIKLFFVEFKRKKTSNHFETLGIYWCTIEGLHIQIRGKIFMWRIHSPHTQNCTLKIHTSYETNSALSSIRWRLIRTANEHIMIRFRFVWNDQLRRHKPSIDIQNCRSSCSQWWIRSIVNNKDTGDNILRQSSEWSQSILIFYKKSIIQSIMFAFHSSAKKRAT